MNEILSTIIIPTYNEQDYVETCLNSLLVQQEPVEEVLVVDNNSKDNTVPLIEKFIKQHPELNIRLLHETQKQGCIHARETAWRQAHGKYIIHVDADEYFLPNWYSTILKVIRTQPELGAFGGTVRFQNAPPIIVAMQIGFNRLYSPLMQMFAGFPYLCGGMTICKREILEKLDGYKNCPSNILDDYYLSEQAVKLGYKTRYFTHIYAMHSIRRYEKGGLKAHLAWGAAAIDAEKYYDPNIR
jgi:glycosyltransferase involved in cell wall biosynthesis